MTKLVFIEPYYAGSHKTLIDLLYQYFIKKYGADIGPESDCDVPWSTEKHLCGVDVILATMTGKKWHWRARTSALYFAQTLPKTEDVFQGTIFASCVLPLHELIALRPDLQAARKIIYFHENQLIYPKQKTKERDFQYGYNQILSCIKRCSLCLPALFGLKRIFCDFNDFGLGISDLEHLAADVVIFNSKFNMESFLSNLKKFFKLQPDYRPKNLREILEPKCKVIYFPIDFTRIPREVKNCVTEQCDEPIRIVWPHRWEHDKNPEMFFRVIFKLVEQDTTNFRISVLGENFADNPSIFEKVRVDLHDYIIDFGFLPSKEKYYEVLRNSDVVISTADHEFFGVAMLEAVYCGCFPLCPDALVYPEIFSSCKESFYSSEVELFSKLKSLISDPAKFRSEKKKYANMDFSRFDWECIKSQFEIDFSL